MKIVIDIPKETYELVKSWNYPTDTARKMLFEMVKNGTPLPEQMAIKALEQQPSETAHGSTYGGVSWGGTYTPKEQQPCEDCISREEMLKLIDYINFRNFRSYENLIVKINELPSVTPKARWIPVIEELPKIGKNVLVYINPVIENRHPIIISSREKGKEKYWTDGTILAWMPLPEPYKAESEDEE